MSKFLLIPNGFDKNSFFNYKFDGIILPLDNFSKGFDYYFSVDEINSVSDKIDTYVIINKFIHSKDLELFKNIISKLNNIKGFFVNDIGISNYIDKDKIIFCKNHFINNYDAINYLESIGIRNAVVSNELTKEELEEIRKNTNSNLYYYLVNRNALMYSRRSLVSNFNNRFNKNLSMNEVLHEHVSDYPLYFKEESEATTVFDGYIFDGEKIDMDYYIININNLDSETRSYILNNYRDNLNINNSNNYFLHNKIGYKVK